MKNRIAFKKYVRVVATFMFISLLFNIFKGPTDWKFVKFIPIPNINTRAMRIVPKAVVMDFVPHHRSHSYK